jgi:hypothetical protein
VKQSFDESMTEIALLPVLSMIQLCAKARLFRLAEPNRVLQKEEENSAQLLQMFPIVQSEMVAMSLRGPPVANTVP